MVKKKILKTKPLLISDEENKPRPEWGENFYEDTYRYLSSTVNPESIRRQIFDDLKSGLIFLPNASYVTPNKFKESADVRQGCQLPHDLTELVHGDYLGEGPNLGNIRVKIKTKRIKEILYVPAALGGTLLGKDRPILEPYASAYTIYGKGGAYQHVVKPGQGKMIQRGPTYGILVKIEEAVNLDTGEIIFPKK